MAELQSTEDLRKGLQQATDEAEKLLTVSEQFLKTIEASAKVLKKDVSVDFGNAAEIAKINKLVEESNKLADERSKKDKEVKTTKKKLQDLTNDELKLRIKEQKAFKDRKKSVENELALEKKSIKSRENLIAVNKALRTEVDKLDITTQADQIAVLNDQIDENTELMLEGADAERKRVKTIGKYTEGIKEALDSTSIFGDEAKKLQGVLNALTKVWSKDEDAAEGAAKATDNVGDATKKTTKAVNVLKGASAVLIAVFTAIGSAFASTRAGGLELRTTFAGIQATFKVLIASLAGAGAGIFKWIKSLGSAFSILTVNTSKWAYETKLSILEATNSFGVFDDKIKETKKEISDLTKEQTDLQKEIEKGNEGLKEAGDSFDNFGERVDEVTKAIIEFQLAEDKLIDSQSKLLISIAKLRNEEELNKALEGENAAAIRDRIKAIEAAVVANDKRTLQEVRLAKAKLELVNLEVRQAREASKLGDAYKLSRELTEKLTDATVELTDAEGERAISAIDNRALVTQLALDVLEQEADFLLDGADNQKTINERKLADDRVTLTEKKKILAQTIQAQKEFQENSQENFNQTLVDLGFEQDHLDLIQEEVDLEQLLNTLRTKGSKALHEQIILLGGSEIANKQIFDHVREINTFQQDNLETIRAIKDETKEIAELEAEIADQKRRLAGEDVEESKKQLIQDRIDILEEEIALEEEGSRKRLELEKEINDLKLEQQDERLKKEEDNNKKAAEQQKELIKQVGAFADSIFDSHQEDLDRQRDSNLANQERLQDAINNGSEEAEKSLAAAEAEQEKIEARQRKLEQQRIRAEAFIAGVQLLAANGGDLGGTIAGITGLSSFVNSLQGFYHGTDDTGNGNGAKDQYGNITGYTHDNEQVWSVADRSDVGNRSRQEIKDLVSIAERGTMAVNPSGLLVAQTNNNAALEQKLDGVIKAIKNQKMESNLYMDGSYITEQVKSDKRKDTLKRKANRFL